MPHQCVRCSQFYEDGSKEIIKGCNCGGKLFFFIKKDRMRKAEKIAAKLNDKEKKQIEKDVFDIVGKDPEEPIILDIESIKVAEPGKYEIDLVTLFKGEPIVYKVGDGKYMIDVIRSFAEVGKKKT